RAWNGLSERSVRRCVPSTESDGSQWGRSKAWKGDGTRHTIPIGSQEGTMSLQLDPDDHDFRMAMALRRRHVSEEQMRQFEGYVAAIFTAFGLDRHTPATEDTP